MTRGIRLLLAENTTNTSGHQAALLWEKGNHNCESLAIMSAIILIKNNLPFPSFLSFFLVFSFSLSSSLSLSSYCIFHVSRLNASAHTRLHMGYFVFLSRRLSYAIDRPIYCISGVLINDQFHESDFFQSISCKDLKVISRFDSKIFR